MIVDDNDALRVALTTEFEAAGWVVWRVASLYEYRLFAELGPPDLIVVDRRLPDGDGASLVKRRGPPVIIFSGNPEEVPGAAAMIVKPRSIKDVVRCAETLVPDDPSMGPRE